MTSGIFYLHAGNDCQSISVEICKMHKPIEFTITSENLPVYSRARGGNYATKLHISYMHVLDVRMGITGRLVPSIASPSSPYRSPPNHVYSGSLHSAWQTTLSIDRHEAVLN